MGPSINDLLQEGFADVAARAPRVPCPSRSLPRPDREAGVTTILIVDDTAANRALLVKLLRPRGYDTVEAGEGRSGLDTARRLAAEGHLDAVLLDLSMPVLDGYGFLAEAAADPLLAEIPMILVTASRDDIVPGIDAGAHDYIVKPFDFAELVVRVRAAVRVKQLQDRLREQNARLESLSCTDSLTGLANRRGLDAELARLSGAARRHHHDLAILLVDVDHFKRINDTDGHTTGDQILAEIGRRIGAGLRMEDVAGRWGGDEFLVALPFTDAAGAAAVAERLRLAVASTPFPFEEGRSLSASVTIGGAAGRACPESLLRRADTALYAAKHAGRNAVRIAMAEGAPT